MYSMYFIIRALVFRGPKNYFRKNNRPINAPEQKVTIFSVFLIFYNFFYFVDFIHFFFWIFEIFQDSSKSRGFFGIGIPDFFCKNPIGFKIPGIGIFSWDWDFPRKSHCLRPLTRESDLKVCLWQEFSGLRPFRILGSQGVYTGYLLPIAWILSHHLAQLRFL